jgi:hypothetical protein
LILPILLTFDCQPVFAQTIGNYQLWHLANISLNTAQIDSILQVGITYSGTLAVDSVTTVSHANKILEYGLNRKLASVDSILAAINIQFGIFFANQDSLARLAKTDTTSLGRLNNIIMRYGVEQNLKTADSLLTFLHAYIRNLDSLSILKLPYLPGIYSYEASAESIMAMMYTQSAGQQSRDSTIQATNLPSIPLIYTQSAGRANRDSTLQTASYTRLREIATWDSTVIAKLNVLALWDSTGSANAPSKLFDSNQDTIKSPNKTIVISLRGTNPPGPDYLIREFSLAVLGDTASVIAYGPYSTSHAVKWYPGEGITPWGPIEADSVVITRPCLDTNVLDARWWARGR